VRPSTHLQHDAEHGLDDARLVLVSGFEQHVRDPLADPARHEQGAAALQSDPRIFRRRSRLIARAQDEHERIARPRRDCRRLRAVDVHRVRRGLADSLYGLAIAHHIADEDAADLDVLEHGFS